MFGKRVLVSPRQSPDISTHQLWIDEVPLCHPACYFLGSTNFEPRSDIVRPNQFVALEIWDSLLCLCISLCIIPPILYLSGIKLCTSTITSLAPLLGEVEVPITKHFIWHGTFKAVIAKILPLRSNKTFNTFCMKVARKNISLSKSNTYWLKNRLLHYLDMYATTQAKIVIEVICTNSLYPRCPPSEMPKLSIS